MVVVDHEPGTPLPLWLVLHEPGSVLVANIRTGQRMSVYHAQDGARWTCSWFGEYSANAPFVYSDAWGQA